ncbi:MAG: S-adenosylmethionine decarboxylase [Deinococcales bacterium]
MVNGVDPLGYGTHLILDGFRADDVLLTDAASVESVLADLGELMNETGSVSRVTVLASPDAREGLSGALVAAESQLCIHTFAPLHKLSLEAFSSRSLPADAVKRVFVERFRVGRVECRIHGRGRLLPRAQEPLELALRGERDYVRLRLRDLLGA